MNPKPTEKKLRRWVPLLDLASPHKLSEDDIVNALDAERKRKRPPTPPSGDRDPVRTANI